MYLDLSGMKMGALPANIDQLNMLQTLIVSSNELTELPASLANIRPSSASWPATTS